MRQQTNCFNSLTVEWNIYVLEIKGIYLGFNVNISQVGAQVNTQSQASGLATFSTRKAASLKKASLSLVLLSQLWQHVLYLTFTFIQQGQTIKQLLADLLCNMVTCVACADGD